MQKQPQLAAKQAWVIQVNSLFLIIRILLLSCLGFGEAEKNIFGAETDFQPMPEKLVLPKNTFVTDNNSNNNNSNNNGQLAWLEKTAATSTSAFNCSSWA